MKITLPEIVAVGLYDSRVAVKDRPVTRSRKTTMFELELPLEKGGISYINQRKEEIEPTLIICAKPGQSRHTKVPYRCQYIHMLLRKGPLYELLMELPDYVYIDDHDHYQALFRRLCLWYETGLETDELMVQGILLELIHSLVLTARKRNSYDKIKHNHEEMISAVIRYIKENLTGDLSLEALADFAGFSPAHFHHCFKASTGQTLRVYVEEQRIKKAANLLTTTDYTLTEIAYECGFSSQSYFSYAFKRKMKSTPREYARRMLERYSD